VAVELTIEMVPDFRIVAQAFNDMAAELAHMEEPLLASAKVAAYQANQRFDEEGPGWADWVLGYQSPAGHGTLGDLTGEMSGRASDAGNYVVSGGFGGGSVSYQFEEEKETAFEFGNSRQVARPFIGLDEEGDAMVESIFAYWLDSIVGSFGGGGGGMISPPMLPPGISLTGIVGFGGTSVFRGAGGRFVSNPFK
jgi:hypothetical protein